jgi:integrase
VASVFKPKGSDRYVIVWHDGTKRRKKIGTKDKSVTQRIANDLENKVALRAAGIVDPREEAYAAHGAATLLSHIEAWTESIRSKGGTAQHVKLHSARALRVVALLKGAKLADIEAPKPATRKGVKAADKKLREYVAAARIADLTSESVQKALARLTDAGRSLQTASHHRNAIKSFAKWMDDTHRTRENILRGVAGFNVKEDPRHERRTISVEEMRALIEAAEAGAPFKSMTGPMRALCYRLAVASGLRYSEIGSIAPESFDWQASAVTIRAAYAKNGQTVTLPIAPELAADLRTYVATIEPRTPIFPLPHDKGAAMVRRDLEAAGILYRDAAGLVFDFHSLRCEMATLADAAGVSPRVVQRMMRHSKLEMTGRYTRPRAVDMESAALMLPSLRTEQEKPKALAATGTDDMTAIEDGATCGATYPKAERRNVIGINEVTSNSSRKVNPLVEGSSPSPVTVTKAACYLVEPEQLRTAGKEPLQRD